MMKSPHFQVQSTGTSNRITLHSKDLVIDEGNVSVTDLTTDLPLPISSIEYDLLNDFLIIQTSQQLLPESRYEVHIPFEAELKKDVVGYYRSSYQDSESQERV